MSQSRITGQTYPAVVKVQFKEETKKFKLSSGYFTELLEFIKDAGWEQKSLFPHVIRIFYWDDDEIISVEDQVDLQEAWDYKFINKFYVYEENEYSSLFKSNVSKNNLN